MDFCEFASVKNRDNLLQYSEGSFIQERYIEGLSMPGTMCLFIEVKMEDLGISPVDPITGFPPAAQLLQISWLWLTNY